MLYICLIQDKLIGHTVHALADVALMVNQTKTYGCVRTRAEATSMQAQAIGSDKTANIRIVKRMAHARFMPRCLPAQSCMAAAEARSACGHT